MLLPSLASLCKSTNVEVSLLWRVSAYVGVNVIAVVHAAAGIPAVADITANGCTRGVVCVPDIFGVSVAAASMLFYLALPPPVTCIRKGNTVLEEDLTFYMSSHLVHPPRKRTLTLPSFFYARLFGICESGKERGENAEY